MDSTVQARMTALHGGVADAARLTVSPNLWAGIGPGPADRGRAGSVAPGGVRSPG
ncbi:hypothetical protein ACFWTC_04225 [Streptomyces sp. NPDC058619]